MANVGNVFYSSDGGAPVHLIVSVRNGFTPADCECEDYTALCGATAQSWWMAGVPKTVVLESAAQVPKDRQLCPKCFPPKNED